MSQTKQKKVHLVAEISQNALVRDSRGKFLILKHISGKWLLPGGRVNEKESFIESLACGTPILTYKRGSAPEIIKDRKNGILDVSIDKLIERYDEVKTIDRGECRLSVKNKFELSNMVGKYESMFAKVVEQNSDK